MVELADWLPTAALSESQQQQQPSACYLRNILSSSGWKSMAVTKSVCLHATKKRKQAVKHDLTYKAVSETTHTHTWKKAGVPAHCIVLQQYML